MWIVNYMAGPIVHMNDNGTVLGTVPLSFQPVALALDPNNGTFWLSSYDGRIHHVDAAGNDLRLLSHVPLQTSLPTPGWFHPASVPSGLAFANDGTLYIAGTFDPNLYHYTTTGTLLNSFPIDPPGWAFTLAIVPDPSLPWQTPTSTAKSISPNLSAVLGSQLLANPPPPGRPPATYDHTTTIDLTDLSYVLNNFRQIHPPPPRSSPPNQPTPPSSQSPASALFFRKPSSR